MSLYDPLSFEWYHRTKCKNVVFILIKSEKCKNLIFILIKIEWFILSTKTVATKNKEKSSHHICTF